MMVTWVKSIFRDAEVATTDTAIYRIIESAKMDMNCIKNEVDKMISYAGNMTWIFSVARTLRVKCIR